MRTKAIALSVVGLVALAATACLDHEGQLALFLTNPATENTLATRQVSVEVIGVEILDNDSGEYITLSSGSQVYELVSLSSATSLLAVADELEVGRYTSVRVRFSEANSQVVNAAGRERFLRIEPTTVTVPAVIEIIEDGSTTVTLGLDLEASLTLKANGTWVLRPVFRHSE